MKITTKTKAEIKATHDAMARFLIALCRHSDVTYGATLRGSGAEKRYRRARALIRRAGMKYGREPAS